MTNDNRFIYVPLKYYVQIRYINNTKKIIAIILIKWSEIEHLYHYHIICIIIITNNVDFL